MQDFTIAEVLDASGGRFTKAAGGLVKDVIIDSRKAAPGSLFVAIKGEKVDGNDYITAADENGAAACLCDKDTDADTECAVIRVDNSAIAVGKIAHKYKMKYNVPTVAVTGSVGKTTTKDMIAAVMSKMGACLKTEGNFNNELGMPLTIFGLEKEHKSAVLEMGMSAFGEIDYLARIARPDVAVITNIGMSHIENLGSREGILKAKMEICNFFGKDNLLIINADNDMLKTVKKDKDYKILSYGIENAADYTACDIEDYGINGSAMTAVTPKGSFKVRLAVAGVHNVYNALSAIAVGEHFGISEKDITDALENFELTAMRLTVEKYGNVTLINDCYNASPDSIRASLNVLKTEKGRRVAILGDVLELGEFAESAHRDIGKMCGGKADILITAGDNARYIAEGAKEAGVSDVIYRPTTDEAAELAAELIKHGDTVLVKASRGMHFEKVCKAIGEKANEARNI